jgi:NTP pyrophosphatase (non-canonical NTP hydrolase)
MRICEYSKLALRTESQGHSQVERITHAALGLCSEFSEMMEHGADYLEELGDLFWYLNLAADACETSLDELDNLALQADLEPLINIGVCSGLIADQAKRALFYKEDFNERNKKGRIPRHVVIINLTQIKTDLLQICDDNDFDVEDVLEANIKKLEARYPKLRFCETNALDRNLTKEKEALDGE